MMTQPSLTPFISNTTITPRQTCLLRLALAVVVAASPLTAVLGQVPPTTPAPATADPKPADANNLPPGMLTREQKVTNILNYLEKDYAKKAVAPYWVTRAMGVISLARSPRPAATTELLKILEVDKDNVVRLLAWQAILARVKELDAKTHARWMTATQALADKDAFKGQMRVALLDVLATVPPNPKSRKIWMQFFSETSAWEPQDMPTLAALARTLTVWKSAFLVETLIKGLIDPNACVRAEYVLHGAGCTSTTAHDMLKPEIFAPQAPKREHPSSTDLWKKVQSEAAGWYQKDKATWKEVTKVADEPWKALQPLYVSAGVPIDQIDPDDKAWTGDLELGRADLDQFEVVFTVDATGSMGDVLAWLRRDIARVMQAMTLLCKEPPMLGVVFYRDKGDIFVTKTLPLTYKLADLAPAIMQMTADGGGDIPEAIQEALTATMQMNWSKAKRKNGGKIVILVGDAPPKPGTEKACNEIAAKGKEAGIKLYACKITTVEGKNDLSTFDDIAKAGGGSTVSADFGRIFNQRYLGPDQKEIPLQTINRPETQLIVAPESADQPPGEKILTHVLTDAINPQYKDRVQPLAQTLLAYCQMKSDAEKRLAYVANTPSLMAGTFNAQKK